MSRFWMWGCQGAEDILRIYEPFRYHDILFHGLCLGAWTDLIVPTPYSDMFIIDGGHDWATNASGRCIAIWWPRESTC